MISNYNSRAHPINEEAYDEATMIDYIGSYASCATGAPSTTYSLQPLPLSSNSSSTEASHPRTQASIVSITNQSNVSTPSRDAVGKMFNNLFSTSSLHPVSLSNGAMENAINNTGHQQTTSPLSSLGELSESNSPVTNNNMYDADDSGLDTTNMSCTTTDGFFFASHTDCNQLIPHTSNQPVSSQTINHSNALKRADVSNACRSDLTSLTGTQLQSAENHPHHRLQHQQLSGHHKTGITGQLGSFFNCSSEFRNRTLSVHSDCSTVTSDPTTLADYASLSTDHASMSSSRVAFSSNRPAVGTSSSTSGHLIRSLPEQTSIADETSTLLEFPISYNTLQSSGVSGGLNSAGVQLKIITEPARHHRARYRTEGSRGAIKDRTGRSFPVIKLIGYNSEPVKLHCYIGHDRRHGEPHLYYQVSRIIGKNITPCNVIKAGGVKMIEIDLLPENDMTAIINCIGIVKERNFDVQRRCNVTSCASASSSSSRASAATGKTRAPSTACCAGRSSGHNSCLKRRQPVASSVSTGRGNNGQVCNRGNLVSSSAAKCVQSTSLSSSGKSENSGTSGACNRSGDVKSSTGFTASINEQGSQSMVKCTSTSRYQVERRSTTCTLVFTCVVCANGTSSNLIAVSEVINCAQILGSPEIHKVSLTRDRATGGSEVFVIGKNFTRDCKIVWDICPPHIKSHFTTPVDFKFWWRECDPESDFTNQNHLVFKVPPLKSLINETNEQISQTDGHSEGGMQPTAEQMAYVTSALFACPPVQVTFRIKCGEKLSEPCLFTFSSTDLPSDCNNLYQSSNFWSVHFSIRFSPPLIISSLLSLSFHLSSTSLCFHWNKKDFFLSSSWWTHWVSCMRWSGLHCHSHCTRSLFHEKW